MSRIFKKFIRFGTGTNDVNSRDLPANFTPSNYTPAQVGTEGNDKVSAHLKGIDAALVGGGGYDIAHTAWSGPANNTSNQTITGLIFPPEVRSFRCDMDIYIENGGTGQWTYISLVGKRKSSSNWTSYELTKEIVGDVLTSIDFNILDVSNSGQVRISVGSLSGYVYGETRFRAITLYT